jgi:hypothetical protein
VVDDLFGWILQSTSATVVAIFLFGDVALSTSWSHYHDRELGKLHYVFACCLMLYVRVEYCFQGLVSWVFFLQTLYI